MLDASWAAVKRLHLQNDKELCAQSGLQENGFKEMVSFLIHSYPAAVCLPNSGRELESSGSRSCALTGRMGCGASGMQIQVHRHR